MQVFKNSRAALATAMTGAALLGAASVAALNRFRRQRLDGGTAPGHHANAAAA
jgi:hypothetical protein